MDRSESARETSSTQSAPAPSDSREPALTEDASGPAVAHGRGNSGIRGLGYRLLPGDAFSYVLHLRPREWPILGGHVVFGLLLSAVSAPLPEGGWSRAALGVALFVIFLNGGTLAINSAFDRDEGDIGYLDNPPPVPDHLFGFGLLLMVVGLALSVALLPAAFTLIYAICLALSILYSVPPFRWKAVAGLDLAINAGGFGILTAWAGWSLGAAHLEPWAIFIMIAFAPLFAALYPLTQLYQIEEDRARGDRTLSIVLGERKALRLAMVMSLIAFILLIIGVLKAPPGPFAASPIVTLAAICLPAVGWQALLLRWLRRCSTMSMADHKRGMYHALQLWALTDIAILAAVLV